jgi:hypothetical protein
LKESSQQRRFALLVKLKLGAKVATEAAGQQEAQEMEEQMGEWEEDMVVDVVIGIWRAGSLGGAVVGREVCLGRKNRGGFRDLGGDKEAVGRDFGLVARSRTREGGKLNLAEFFSAILFSFGPHWYTRNSQNFAGISPKFLS